MPFRHLFASTIVVALFAVSTAAASDDEDTTTIAIGSWLALPSVEVLAPAFAEDDANPLDHLRLPLHDVEPASGDAWTWPGDDEPTAWEPVEGATVELGGIGSDPAVRVLATRLRVTGFVEAELKVRSFHRLDVWVDGTSVGSKATLDDFEKADDEPGAVESTLELAPGDHTLIVVAGGAPDRDEAWTVEARLEVASDAASRVAVVDEGRRHARLTDVLDLHAPSGLALSPNGSFLAVTLNQPAANSDDRRSWIEFLDPSDGRVLRSLEGVGVLSGFEWAPTGNGRYSFVERDDGKATLWVGEATGSPDAVLEGVENFGSTTWMPDGASIVYAVDEDGPEDPDDFKRYRGLSDRWGGSRDVSSLYQVSVPDGIARRLTAGDLSTSLRDIADGGDHLLFTRSLRDDATWPFARTELVELDLASLDTEVLATEDWGLDGDYSASGDMIAITSTPQAFAGVGLDVDDEVIANLYETQLFLMDRESGEVRAVSRDFDPAIAAVAWVGDRDALIVRATDRSHVGLFLYDVARQRWSELDTPSEVVSSMTIARDGRTVAYLGGGTNVPPEVWSASPRNWQPERIQRYDGERLDAIAFGDVRDFDVAVAGGTIVGRVYYPPGFDPSSSYPTIVYYYGGTSPVTRTYGGRYPKEWWAANGYLVYVMQPSGATGFGQEFAARHVNNWGTTVADEIIGATEAYLEAHEFADPARLGCIGASYGGFMTMLLTTRTDMFAAAVSHAGISSISSYWGEGNWGFAYSAAATAESYPWNRPDIYVDQSPLFAADEVTTPVLLLHGAIDNNVPPGESEQFYTALRVLGKEVEYIRIDGELHWILQYDRRKRWSESIVAWFDKHLKDDSGWWDHLWPADE